MRAERNKRCRLPPARLSFISNNKTMSNHDPKNILCELNKPTPKEYDHEHPHCTCPQKHEESCKLRCDGVHDDCKRCAMDCKNCSTTPVGEKQHDEQGHLVNGKKELIYDKDCYGCREVGFLTPHALPVQGEHDEQGQPMPFDYAPHKPTSDWGKDKYIQMWDGGEFSWNGDIKNSINPERMWQVFIEPAIAQAKEEGRREGSLEIISDLAKKHRDAIMEEARLATITLFEEEISRKKESYPTSNHGREPYDSHGYSHALTDLLAFAEKMKATTPSHE